MSDQKLSTQEGLLLLLDLQDGMKNRSQHLCDTYTVDANRPTYLGTGGPSGRKNYAEDVYGPQYKSIDFWIKEIVSLLSEK